MADPILIDDPLPGIPERLLHRKNFPNRQLKYLVKWQGFDEKHATWEDEINLKLNYNHLILDYEQYNLTGLKYDGMPLPKLKQLPKKKTKPRMTLQDHWKEFS